MYVNENFLNLQENYLFSNISKKISEFQKKNPDKKIIKMGIGDVTKPIVPEVIKAIHKATDEMGDILNFKGYPPEQGYDFLVEQVIENDYKKRNIDIRKSEVFISDGAKSDTGNIVDLFGKNNIIGITNPVYPVYLDSNIISGNEIRYITMNKENNFIPEIPNKKLDIMYLCFPNNPTGTVINKEQLKQWVDYAIKNNAIIIYDSAYEAFIRDENIAHSIYEIDGAKSVAIEVRSFSKTAGFTGLRCGYTIIPEELEGFTVNNEKVKINKLWKRRQSTKFNGVSYIIQKAAEATYSEKGKKQISENIEYYLNNANLIYNGFKNMGYEVYGGKNAPYVWIKTPNKMKSWEFFDYLLNEKQIVGTPGSGFGNEGEGYFRFSAFADIVQIQQALDKFK